MSALTDAIVEIYHAWLQDRRDSGQEGVFKKDDAWAALQQEIQQFITSAITDDPIRAAPDLEHIAKSIFDKADDALTNAGDRIIRATSTGQEMLPLQRLDALVALGKGDRVLFGDMKAEEYQRADERHYKNLRDVQNAYDEWRRAMEPYQGGWTRGLSVRQIEAEGDA